MKYTIYKPNSNVSGAMMGLHLTDDRDGVPIVFLEFVKQSGWDDSKKRGSFKINKNDPSAKSVFAMNVTEAGEFIASFENNLPFSAFHNSKSGSSKLALTTWNRKRKIRTKNGEEVYEIPSFGISFSRGDAYYKVPIDAGEAKVMIELLKGYIRKSLFHASDLHEKNFPKQNQQSQHSQTHSQAPDDDIPF